MSAQSPSSPSSSPASSQQLSSAVIRQRFLRYFEGHAHRLVKSSALVPHNDPTLLFTNAGMVQFKDLFTGKEKRDYSRATTSQKCLRAGGKHNDLENVGVTARHHTFFEMLGNFSFGDYFKEDAIRFAWEFVTGELGVDPKRLAVTIFKGEEGVPADEEAGRLWHERAGVDKGRILRLGMKDNFWSMGDTGPCGPCSEIHFFSGGVPSDKDMQRLAGDGEGWLEIWNLVFMQFERHEGGKLDPLPKPSIDTGMGLERVTSVQNGLSSNYDTDLLRPLIERAASMCKKTYKATAGDDDVSLRVLADHARATAFLIADGVFPSNEGRGYVLRRIMRRAIRHGERLGFDDVFFYEVTDEVVKRMGDVYPELTESRAAITSWVKNEEEGFRRTLRTGLKLLSQRVERVKQDQGKVLGGADAFELYDTYGFPLDLTEVILREHGLSVEQAGFDAALEKQRARAGAFKNEDQAVADVYKALALERGQTAFLGYELSEEERGGRWQMRPAADASAETKAAFVETKHGGFVRAKVKALVQGGASVNEASGDFDVVLDPTPFYGESGGQIGDRHGELAGASGEVLAQVRNTRKPVDGFHVSEVHSDEKLRVGDEVLARYDAALRRQTRAHHSATHLLHKALRDVLGEHVKQAGSLVAPDRLRFDFSHFEALTPDQMDKIEAHVKKRVSEGARVVTDVLDFEAAKKAGAVALFGEKYGDRVRVLTIADSKELCGGTHAKSTADIGELRVTKEEAIAAGVRRVEAVVADAAHKLDAQREAQLLALARLVTAKGAGQASPDATPDATDDERWLRHLVTRVVDERKKLGESAAFSVAGEPAELGRAAAGDRRALLRLVAALRTAKTAQRHELQKNAVGLAAHPLLEAITAWLDEAERLDKRVADGKSSQASESAQALVKKAKTVQGMRLVAEVLLGVEPKELRTYADRVRDLLGSGVVALGVVADGKASVVVAVSKDLTGRVKAGEVVKAMAQRIGGSGGGKPDFAQAGGPKVAELPGALSELEKQLS